jgi:hypothetical protein
MRGNFREGFWFPAKYRRSVGVFCVTLGLVAGGLFIAKIWIEDSLRDVAVSLKVISDKELVSVKLPGT